MELVIQHLIGFTGIIYGLGVAHILLAFANLAHPRTSVRWDWIPLMFAFFLILQITDCWWGMLEDWVRVFGEEGKPLTQKIFLLYMAAPLLLFYCSAVVLPTDINSYDDETDLREHWDQVRPHFALGLSAFVIVQYSIDLFEGDPWLSIRQSEPISFLLYMSLFFTGSRTYQTILLLFGLVALILTLAFNDATMAIDLNIK